MWTVIDHGQAVTLLEQSLRQGKLAHAYLFVGPRRVGKMTLALNLAQALNCIGDEDRPFDPDIVGTQDRPCQHCTQCQRIAAGKHSDVVLLEVQKTTEDGIQKKAITVEQVKELQNLAHLKPFEGRWRVFVINGVEHLSSDAANRLLKTLEEPPPHVLMVLLSVEERSVLPTVLSRCQRLFLQPLPLAQIERALVERGKEPAEARLLAHLSEGSIGWALSAAEDRELVERRHRRLQELVTLPEATAEERFADAGELTSAFFRDRDELRERLATWRSWWRDLLLAQEGLTDAVTNLDMLQELQAQAPRFSRQQVVSFLESLEKAWRSLEVNANPRLTLEVLMLDLPRAPSTATTA